jgi:DNA-binding response OmpR family regulator
MIHALVARTLERAGWDVLNAFDGLQAVQLLGLVGHAPSLIITDMRMPRMNGAELAQWVESLYPTVPILFISGFMDTDPAPVNGGRRAALGKPFTPAILLQTVRELCSTTAQTQH